ncbi:MAG: class I SAM-dependent methyltransferase [Bacteroidetes bacterium]|nr:class I SAM-dependent methyltransferase [Bacteroidota bacterium]
MDEIIVNKFRNKQVLDYLDVGSGDGIRAISIAKKIACKKITLVDNSEILHSCRNLTSDINISLNLIKSSICEIQITKKYDLITCLWNVLGHLNDIDERERTFLKFKKVLSKHGSLVIDVNNRYNISNYGYVNVMHNLSRDILNDLNSGWFTLNIGNDSTNVYIHAPLEIDAMCNKVGLKVSQVIYIDYNSGEVKDTFFEGQLLYIISHA